jgi:glycosyltransferase involved in cell wall biosynthesis
MKILCFSRFGRLGASSRLRFYQYISYLQAHGIEITVAPLLNDVYIENLYAGGRKHLGPLFGNYLNRFYYLLKSTRFDLLWIEKELLPWLPAWGEMLLACLDVSYVVDYDDAVFHRYDLHPNSLVRTLLRRKIDAVMRHAKLVIAGNDYLADRARQVGASHVEYLPTVIDLNRYNVVPPTEGVTFTIGWIGSPVTSHYLHLVQPALQELCNDGSSRLVLVGSGKMGLNGVPLEIRSWSEETENKDIHSFDVGIMPLPDDPWERGKCGYKLIQYMASGRPVVSSPVGINQKIVEDGVNGFLANTMSEWLKALRNLRDNRNLRESMGKAGRSKVELQFCLQVTAPHLVTLLRSVVKELN